MRALMVLGCEGNKIDEFCFCNKTSSVILDLEKIENNENYLKAIEYLDAMGMFEGLCNKSTKISNIIYKLYSMNLISEELYKKISYYYNMHIRCGLVLFLQPKE